MAFVLGHILVGNGHKVSIVKNPTLSLEGDADATHQSRVARPWPAPSTPS